MKIRKKQISLRAFQTYYEYYVYCRMRQTRKRSPLDLRHAHYGLISAVLKKRENNGDEEEIQGYLNDCFDCLLYGPYIEEVVEFKKIKYWRYVINIDARRKVTAEYAKQGFDYINKKLGNKHRPRKHETPSAQ